MASSVKLPGGGFFGRGNHKLGSRVLTWSLPALSTCPGKSKVCTEKLENGAMRCYATQHMTGFQQPAYYANLEASRSDLFVGRAVDRLTRMVTKCDTVRLHVSGDFYSPEYVDKWADIVRRCPSQRFWAYTRSYRVSGFDAAFRRLAALTNISLWYSLDKATGYPAVIPERVRTCYLAVDDDDANSIRPEAVDLLFRDYPSRTSVLTSVGGKPVCPHENGKTSYMTCERCRICIRPSRIDGSRQVEGGKTRRIPLSLVN